MGSSRELVGATAVAHGRRVRTVVRALRESREPL